MSKEIKLEALKKYSRSSQAMRYLDQKNVSSIGIGYKKGKNTKQVCIQFTVDTKVAPESLESINEIALPKEIEIDGVLVPTDVIERSYESNLITISALKKSSRKTRIDPIQPGCSIAHSTVSAGTAGCVVYDQNTGEKLLLSNWHVLQGEEGEQGDSIVQPGRHDDGRTSRNKAGELVNGHLGLAGDCAVARIEERSLDDQIIDLGVAVKKIGEPELDDLVIKSGRTTEVTLGIVSRVNVTVDLNYGGSIGVKRIGCFEYVPDPKHPPVNGEVSMGGDSGSAVMYRKGTKATETMVGLHFAGEVGNAREHGLACYSHAVFKKLNISPQPPEEIEIEKVRRGFDWNFLGKTVRPPYPVRDEVMEDILKVKGKHVIHYTHFSLIMSKSRKFASWVAWNIDGGNIKIVSRKNIPFTRDPRLPDHAQVGNELYEFNPLDRGHIARRAELCWGTRAEAERANKDSFYYTNMAPQHERFNQSKKAGLWGRLENAIFEGGKILDLKMSVMAGPVFKSNDQTYRNIKIPREFWKVVSYVDEGTRQLKCFSFILSQSDLISGMEGLDLDDFDLYRVPLHEITARTGLEFKDLEIAEIQNVEENATEAMSNAMKLESEEHLWSML